ncbi:5'-AMP-activated protein kinase beta subunit, interation domain-containing protein [Crepidotus variabilis]|uniref:5'-AMP-activated protein kinase beta subunit, interation domain-containing protein n=1 Tax=Crepidotus variabilis TaxID=179855 RepID=A0A9P6EAV4_9AGAR|nr:5'-AMP-activated protein kinase beta subunit, interation domain-containing protein [Crepidotus variabilis]
MGNSASNPSRPPHSSISPNGGRSTTSPGTRQSSTSPTPGNPHRSMRTKKRSLELPDLASLSLTPSATNTRGRQTKQAAMPIAIPTAAAGARNPFSHYSEAQGIPSQEGRRRRPKNYFESTGSIAGMVVSQPETESREGSRGPDGEGGRTRDSNIVEEEYEDVVPLEPSTHLPFPPPSREQQMRDRELREQSHQHQGSQHSSQHSHASSSRRNHTRQAPAPQTPAQAAARQAQVNRIQELYDRSQDPHPSAPPSSPASISQTLGVAPPGSTPTASNTGSGSTRAREIVRSSIPIALGQRDLLSTSGTLPPAPPATATAATVPLGTIQEDLLAADGDADLEQEPAPVLITWRGGGTEVLLARAGDDEWKGRQVMEREHPNSIIFRATVYLRPGSHHIRFLVDGQWRVADDLPAAVDDQGSLANYVSVGDPTPVLGQPSSMSAAAAAPPMTAATRRMVPGQSFWSAKSEGGDEDGYDGDSVDGHGRQGSQNHQGGQGTGGSGHSYIQARWTSVLPLELIEAAREEEAYLTASAGQYEAQNAHAVAAASRVVVTGFVPAPNIPPAPGLPRHLDKLILNSRVGGGGGNSGSGQGSGSATGERAGTPNSGHGHGVGSGQGGSGRRERERREKERRGERERDERERGDRERERERGDRERGERDRERERGERERTARTRRANIPPPPPPSEDGSGSNEMDIENTYIPMNRTSAQAAAAAAAAAASGSVSGLHTAESSASSTGGGTSTALTTPHVSVPPTPTGPLSPTQSPPKTSYMEGNVPIATSPPPLPPSTSASASNTTPSSPAPAGSRAITIDTANMPSLTDDASVLAVPSHVVLHHLCTSAIKNGVLAVASTTRYKKKYLTTIYYKPT